MRRRSRHGEWLGLIEVSGPFLTLAVLDQAFPNGLEAHEPAVYRPARPDDDARRAEREHLLDVGLPKQPAPDLNLDGRGLQHRADELVIVRPPIGAVHVDEVDPARPGAGERVERRQRLGHGAVSARHAPAFYVNGGIELHEMCSEVGG